jgi:cyclopropane-fatty-acyl-phospholipid synthase
MAGARQADARHANTQRILGRSILGIAARLVLERLTAWREGGIVVELPDGTAQRYGDGNAERPVRVRVNDWRFFTRALTGGDIGVGESYMDGKWDCSDLTELFRLFLLNQSVLSSRSPWNWLSTVAHRARRIVDVNTRFGSRRNIRYHYDLSNQLFATFLDESMTYSCGVFCGPDASLADAQREKIDGACRAIDLRPGQQLLEIGSGWGSFAMHAAREYGCRVTALTLSEQQLRLARERARQAGLAEQIDFQLCDYRDARGSHDHIVSIEMLEAVGAEYYGTFFKACDRLLRPGGRVFLQAITVPDQRFDAYRKQFDWIRKYIFPGGCLASLGAINAALKKHTSFQIEWLRDIGHHYAPTLRHWRERFLGRLPEVRRLGFDERFIRMWEFYLASCEAAFAARYIGDVQMVLSRPLEPRSLPA